MKYDLFLSDFDGTLVREDGTISEKNISAIREYRERGGIFAVVTGRMLSSIRPRLLKLNLSDTLVAAYQGGIVARTSTGEILIENRFCPEGCVSILKYLEQNQNLHIQIYADEVLYSNRKDEFLKFYESKCGVTGRIAQSALSALVSERNLSVLKICVIVEPGRRNELYPVLKKRFGETFCVTGSSEWMIEILPKAAQKGLALRFLAERYQIPLDKVAAIGDQDNDLSMIEAAGGKFAVANAVPQLKQIASVVSSSEQDGVSEALRIAMEEA